MFRGFVFFLIGIGIALGQVIFLDYLDQFDYLAFVPTAVALIFIWYGIHLMGKNRREFAYS